MRLIFLLSLGLVTTLSMVACVENAECPSGARKQGTRCIRVDDGSVSALDGATAMADAGADEGEAGAEPSCAESERVTLFRDRDGDGFGGAESIVSCEVQDGYVEQGDDCNDRLESVYPGSVEGCNGVDDDCDGEIDEGQDTRTYYPDCDGDGFAADEEGAVTSCKEPPLPSGCLAWTTFAPTTARTTDCDPKRAEYYPGAPFGIPPAGSADKDLNCDGLVEGANEVFIEKYLHKAEGEGPTWLPYGKRLPLCDHEYLPKLGWLTAECPPKPCVAFSHSDGSTSSFSVAGPGPCVRVEPSLSNPEENVGKYLPLVLGLHPDKDGVYCSAIVNGVGAILCR